MKSTPVLVVHGGAGTVRGEERRQLAEKGILEALTKGYEILEAGGSALDAVETAVAVMEDLPQFNAGYGSVVTNEKTIEMDAMIVDGATGGLGGVAGVSKIKNPIKLSRKIMENSQHVLFIGEGAELFAENNGIELIDPDTLITPRVLERLEQYNKKKGQDAEDPEGRKKYGTVGAVALDINGHLAAATSTGGTLGKQKGRVGDTPIFGAGTYADEVIAGSSTGVGEYIIKGMLALRTKYNFLQLGSLVEGTKLAVREVEEKFGQSAIISIDKEGNWAAEHSTDDLVYAAKSKGFIRSFREDETVV